MYIFVISVHLVLCTILVFVILMQPGKGADISSAFGGGSSSQIFGAAGSGNFLTRGTAVVAALFMVTSVALTFLGESQSSGGGAVKDIVKDVQDDGKSGGGFGLAPSEMKSSEDGAGAEEGTQDAPEGRGPAAPAGSAAPPLGEATPAGSADPAGAAPPAGSTAPGSTSSPPSP